MPRIYQRKHLLDGTLNPRFKHRKRPSGKSGRKKGKFERGHFIGWDGEGVTDDVTGLHRYVMLVNSDGQSIVDAAGLTTRDCLSLLCEVGAKHRHAIHTAFGASYDVNMILADCSHTEIENVWAGGWVPLCNGEFIVNYRPRKSFTVKRAGYVNRGGYLSKRKEGIVLWDVFGFFQSSFVEALKKYIGTDYEPLALITKRKAERSTFDPSQLQDILEYCQLECTALVDLMERLRDYLIQANLQISRWDGAGACAAALLKREEAIKHKRSRNDTPQEVLDAAQHAYAGGRTETLRYGHAPKTPIYHYDINSAYPYAMEKCPSLSDGRWTRVHGSGINHSRWRDYTDFSLHLVEWDFASGAMAYPFFWRSFDTSIYYPRRGRGWYWKPELSAAYRAMESGAIVGNFRVNESWLWEPANDEYPFTWISELFKQRKEWKAKGIGAEKVVKLAINSLYGKTAQHLGGSKDEPPRYHQLEWAGFITSSTRAKLYDALAPAISAGKRNGIMLATDAVYSLEPLDLPTGDELGKWSYEPHDGITVIQSGVYWTYNDGKAKAFCRGFDKGSLDCNSIVSAWKSGAEKYEASLTRFVTMGSALASKDTFEERWHSWRTTPRMLALNPNGTKRADIRARSTRHNPAKRLIETQPAIPAAQLVGQRMSAPYPLPWSEAGDMRDQYYDGAPLRIVEQEALDSEV